MEASTVRKLLDTIEDRLSRLARFSGISLEAYLQDVAVQDRVERNFEVCIQACIALAAQIVASLPSPQPNVYGAGFMMLAEQGLITPELGMKMQRFAAFRDVLVHRYADVDGAKVYGKLERLDDIREFVKELTPHLERTGVL